MYDSIAPPAGWVIPEGWTFVNIAACRSCFATVAWCKTPAGRAAPVNRDGMSHFATCPQSDSWRKPKWTERG